MEFWSSENRCIRKRQRTPQLEDNVGWPPNLDIDLRPAPRRDRRCHGSAQNSFEEGAHVIPPERELGVELHGELGSLVGTLGSTVFLLCSPVRRNLGTLYRLPQEARFS